MGSNVDCYYALDRLHEEYCHPDVLWKESAYVNMLCCNCHSVPPDWFPRPVDIRLKYVPKKSAIEGIWETGVKVFHRELIEALLPHLVNFVLGECYDCDGDRVGDYVTAYARERVILRGNRYSHYQVCERCSCAWLRCEYQIKRDGTMDEFILRKDAQLGHILQDAGMSLYVSSLVAESINWRKFPSLELHPVQIIDRPFDKDRLPGDPDWTLGREALPASAATTAAKFARGCKRFVRSTSPAKAPRAGDVFAFQSSDKRVRFGRVISTQGRAKEFRDCVLFYIYDVATLAKRPVPELSRGGLMLPPMLSSSLPWSCGFFELLENRPLDPGDVLDVHCFYDSGVGDYVNERGERLSKREEVCGIYAFETFRTIEEAIVTAIAKNAGE